MTEIRFVLYQRLLQWFVCLFVCLCVCLFVCLFFAKHIVVGRLFTSCVPQSILDNSYRDGLDLPAAYFVRVKIIILLLGSPLNFHWIVYVKFCVDY